MLRLETSVQLPISKVLGDPFQAHRRFLSQPAGNRAGVNRQPFPVLKSEQLALHNL